MPSGAVEPPVFTLRYAPPESVLALHQKTTITAHPNQDVWAIGVLAFEMMSGQLLFPMGSTSAEVQQVLIGERRFPHEEDPSVWRKVGKLSTLVQRMLSRDATQRPTAVEVSAQVDNLANVTGATLCATVPHTTTVDAYRYAC